MSASDAPPRHVRGSALLSRARRQALVEIAYRHIATKGFEGLRVRAVAQEAGINHATLLHYFPTKEALIQGVVAYLLREFQGARAPRPHPGPLTTLEEVRLQLEDMRYRLHDRPEMFIVLTELLARSLRDPDIARMLRQLDAAWHGHLVALLDRGIATNEVRPELDAPTVATALIAQIKGLGLQTLGHTDPTYIDSLVTQLATQIEHWLTDDGALPKATG